MESASLWRTQFSSYNMLDVAQNKTIIIIIIITIWVKLVSYLAKLFFTT